MNSETLARIKDLQENHSETLNVWVNGSDILKKAFAETVLKIEV